MKTWLVVVVISVVVASGRGKVGVTGHLAQIPIFVPLTGNQWQGLEEFDIYLTEWI